MLIDHLIYRAPDLAGAVADLEERLGVQAQAGGQHIGLGTHNALLALARTPIWRSSLPIPGGLILESFHLEHPIRRPSR